jgi:hypothetical protein
MRRGFGILGLLVTVVVIAIVGVIAYQAGWSDGFAQHVSATDGTTAVAPYPYYGGFYGPHFFGFGWIFGLLFFLFLSFIFIRIVAFGLFFGGRRGWGYGRGWGMHGGGVPPAIDERMKEWHRQAHGDAPATSTPSTPPPPPVADK